MPLLGEDGSRLKYVSPRQVRLSKKFAESWPRSKGFWRRPSRRSKDRNSRPLQDKARNLDEALGLFHPVELRPRPPRQRQSLAGERFRRHAEIVGAIHPSPVAASCLDGASGEPPLGRRQRAGEQLLKQKLQPACERTSCSGSSSNWRKRPIRPCKNSSPMGAPSKPARNRSRASSPWPPSCGG